MIDVFQRKGAKYIYELIMFFKTRKDFVFICFENL